MIVKKKRRPKQKLRRSDISVFQNLNNKKTISPLRGSIIHMNSLYYNHTTPSGLEQQKIVEEIEARLTVADKIEAEIESNLKKTEQLRQSILKKAFEGKLVPQDSNDPSASKLLEQIKKEKILKN